LLANQAIPIINELGRKREPFFLLVDFELENIKVQPLSELDSGILYNINGTANSSDLIAHSSELNLEVEPYPFDKYYHEFQEVMEEILYGNTFLINLTSRNKIKCRASLLEIFNSAKAKYKLLIDQKCVVFSPETFVKIQDNKIYSYPMKGTIDADIPNAKELLLNSIKETAEHNTIIDLIRNDLSISANKVEVTRYKYLDLIESNNKNLYQMSSEISGTLPHNYEKDLGNILFSLLPAGSISGAPKHKTLEIIQKTEPYRRGNYSGICGIYDGQNFDSFVMIRYIEKDGDNLYYRSGGGITFQSIVEKEYQEMLDKIYIPN